MLPRDTAVGSFIDLQMQSDKNWILLVFLFSIKITSEMLFVES